MMSLVAQPAMPLAIFLHHQASKFVSRCQALCRAWSWSASSLFLKDDSLESLEGVSSLRLGWCHFCQMDWIFSPGSDSVSGSSCMPKMWLVQPNLRASLPIFAIGCHLTVAQDLNFTLAGLCILIFTGGVLLLVGGFGFAACFLAVVSDLALSRAQLLAPV